MPGQFYSLSDQCRIALDDPKSFACESSPSSRINRISTYTCKLYCALKNKCQYQQFDFFNLEQHALDGTWCGKGKVCLFFECVDVEPKNGDKFKGESSNIVPESLRNNDQHNIKKIEYSAQMLGHLCPFGASNENYHLQKPIRENGYNGEITGYDLIEYAQTCENIFKKYRDERNEFCTLYHATYYLCCEKCIQYNMAKTIRSSMKINGKVRCESFVKTPCYNDGKCVNVGESNDLSRESFRCQCKKGYSGRKLNLNFL